MRQKNDKHKSIDLGQWAKTHSDASSAASRESRQTMRQWRTDRQTDRQTSDRYSFMLLAVNAACVAMLTYEQVLWREISPASLVV